MRFELLHEITDLDEAILLEKLAIDRTPSESDSPGYPAVLGTLLTSRFICLKNVNPGRAIVLHPNAIAFSQQNVCPDRSL